ncbi:MAG: DDE-type integrase/transposase/recombinase [Phycisphaeraceae bacterium]|nr:DDE-type integrase/transposase/recombinase [Phycisphaeraceae bacterium]
MPMPLLSNLTALKIVDSVAVILSQALQLARIRLASANSPVLRMMAERDQAIMENQFLRRELEIGRGQREAMPPHRRPDYTPEHRLAILQLMRLRDWSVAIVAKRFVLHPNTVRAWIKAVEGRGNDRLLTPAIVWNRIDDVVRWAVHELRRLCPEPEFGTRTIARHLVRAGVQISRTSVQRILREPKSRKPRRRPPMIAAGIEPHHLLKPAAPNRVWHLDLTTFRVLWLRFTIAAVLDGCTRRLLVLHVFHRVPRADQMIELVKRTMQSDGKPRFLITDHGQQFRKRFGTAMKDLDIHHVRGRVGQPFLNGKIERLFRSLRLWWRFILPRLTADGIQRKLDNFRGWYNAHRVHAALSAMTPNEAAHHGPVETPIPIRQRDRHHADFDIARYACRGDPCLPIIDIHVQLRQAA